MKSQQIIEVVKRDHWTNVKGTHGKDPLFMRYRDEFCAAKDLSGYPHMLRITWTYTDMGHSGLPNRDQTDEMAEFENHLVAVLEHDYLAVLVAVITERGTRQWILYVSDMSECGLRINRIPEKRGRYPIALVAEYDVEWIHLHEIIQAIGAGSP